MPCILACIPSHLLNWQGYKKMKRADIKRRPEHYSIQKSTVTRLVALLANKCTNKGKYRLYLVC